MYYGTLMVTLDHITTHWKFDPWYSAWSPNMLHEVQWQCIRASKEVYR